MKNRPTSALARWLLGGVLLAALLFGLAAPASAQDEFGHSTITVLAPGAPAGAVASVQWLDRAGTWRAVEGWQAELEPATTTGPAMLQWAVYPKDYGRGPFRWVITNASSAWATSASFYLPTGDGAASTTTVAPAAAGGPVVGVPRPNFSTITVQVPGVPEGAWVGVQWRDVNGNWHNVDGWQGPLERSTATGQSSKHWGVFERDYGRGPFRWIVYAPTGGAVFATSPSFFLPSGGGANLAMTVLPQIAVVPADELTAELVGEPAALPADTSTSGLNCAGQQCNFSVISLSAPAEFAGSQVVVQWLDPLGVWHDVPTWRGSLDQQTGQSAAYQQWTLSTDLQGRGPFRWVIYNELGDALVGVTPSFTLPDRPGVNLNMTLPAGDFSDITG